MIWMIIISAVGTANIVQGVNIVSSASIVLIVAFVSIARIALIANIVAFVLIASVAADAAVFLMQKNILTWLKNGNRESSSAGIFDEW